MCFNKVLNPINCGTSLVGGGKCNPLKKVLYPTFESKIEKNPPSGTKFMHDIAEMVGREMMRMDEEEEEEEAELWENFMENGNAEFMVENPWRQNSTRL